jgi:hypothetical protein
MRLEAHSRWWLAILREWQPPRKLTFVESRSTDEGRRDDSLQQQAREVVNLTKKGESQATNASAVGEASLIEGVVVGVEVTAIQDNGEKAQEDKVCMEVDVTEISGKAWSQSRWLRMV